MRPSKARSHFAHHFAPDVLLTGWLHPLVAILNDSGGGDAFVRTRRRFNKRRTSTLIIIFLHHWTGISITIRCKLLVSGSPITEGIYQKQLRKDAKPYARPIPTMVRGHGCGLYVCVYIYGGVDGRRRRRGNAIVILVFRSRPPPPFVRWRTCGSGLYT